MITSPQMPPQPESMIHLTQALVQCASVTPSDDGVMHTLQEAARAAGFTEHTFVAEGQDGHKVHNMYAQMGEGRPVITFMGHVDVVPPGPLQSWHHPPFAAQIHDGRLFGRGTADMKGAIAAFVVAAQRYHQSVTTLPGAIGMMITGDEEEGSPQGMRALIAWLPPACFRRPACR